MAQQTGRLAKDRPRKYCRCIQIENTHPMMYKYVKNY